MDNRKVMRALRQALKPEPGIDYGKNHWPAQVCNRLTTLAIYSVSDKSQVPETAMTCLKCFSSGMEYNQIADYVRLSPRTVEDKITQALKFIVENTPEKLLERIPIIPRRWVMRGCQRCKGSLFWDGEEGVYVCINCGGRHKNNGELIH